MELYYYDLLKFEQRINTNMNYYIFKKYKILIDSN